MRIFVFGSNGMLGNYIKSYFSSKNYVVIGLSRYDYDLSELTISSLREFLLVEKEFSCDDIIINCAGVIPQALSNNVRNYFLVNSLFPVILSQICQEIGAKMIHVTTDCVFTGSDGNYNELSEPDETSSYGVSKSLGDLADCCVIRTSIIGEEINNKRSLLEWVRSNRGKEINGYVNHIWNGVTCLELAKIIHKIINNYYTGVRHIFSPRSVSKYELVSMINEIYELDIKVNKFETIRIDKTLSTTHQSFNVPDLSDQIKELKNFKLI